MSILPPSFRFTVAPEMAGYRLDRCISAEIDHCSRSFAATLIRQGRVTVDGAVKKPGYVVRADEDILGAIPTSETPRFQAQNIPLHILYEDHNLIVVDKVPGMVVHPSPGHSNGTLVNALLHHCPDMEGISGSLRPGIVHRLDKDTSGVLVAAKNSMSMNHLAAQFKNREVRKRYLALVFGIPKNHAGEIDLPIGRHPTDRKKMSVHTHTPRAALTYWQLRESFAGASLLELDIRTGRTHQIRVHCQSMAHPLIGDPVYVNRGAKKRLAALSPTIYNYVAGVTRQMLHAWKLSIVHPGTGERMSVKAPIPGDMLQLLEMFRGRSIENRAPSGCQQ